MAEISAATVMKLRKMSGQGMMDCKKALADAQGDFDKAMEILRKKGLATLAKRAERETSEGLVISRASDQGKTAVLVTLCCETDFVAKSDDFIAAADKLGDYAMACTASEGVENVLETELDGKKFSEVLTDTVSKTGEKTELGDYARFTVEDSGFITTYVHFNKKIGTMILIQTSDDSVAASDELKDAVNDIAMHITAVNPLALDSDGLDPEAVEAERKVYMEQVKDKPANIIDKIVEGKMQKFFSEKCLLSQPFVKDDKMTVAQVLENAAKKAGGQAKIVKFVRFSVSG